MAKPRLYKSMDKVTTSPCEYCNDKIAHFVKQTRLRQYFLNNEKQAYLSRRELECLLYALRGYTAAETAKQFNLSHKTVEGYIATLKSKLGCRKRSALFRKAIELGLINVADLL